VTTTSESDQTVAIRQALDTVERDRGVRILFACESDSRGWGFESQHSDDEMDGFFRAALQRAWHE
jgi:hypothetical protein